MPLIALIVIAMGGDTATLRHVASTVLPRALAETALLLAGVAIVAGVAGVGTAWLVSAYRFPGRLILQAALVLPLAVPPYI
ncbi:MAG: iron ABC transporter permease, partial [Alsobacter sp.]